MNATRTFIYGGAGAGVAIGAGIAALAAAGRRVADRHDEHLDGLQVPPEIVQEHRIAVADGGSIYVAEFGDAASPPIVLLHGVTLQWQFWSAVIRLLAPSHRVLVIETRGHGRSSAGGDGVSLSAGASDLVSVLDELDCAPAVIAGHSMGGMILGALIAEHPDRIDDLVAGMGFIATSGGPPTAPGPTLALTRVQAPGSALLSQLVNRGFAPPPMSDTNVARGLVRVATGPAATARMIDDLRRMQEEMDISVTAESLVSIAAHDVHDEMRALARRRPELPVGIIVGDVDRLTPPICARDIARCFPNPTFRHLPAIGHQVPQEAPHEVADLISGLSRAAAGRSSGTAAAAASAS